MNFALILLTFITILSDVIELTYDLGQYTRKYVLPAVLYCGVAIYHYGLNSWDYLTSQEYKLKVYSTPLTSGLAYC